jgi:leader peptidase (prepilin peptidase)/N-methyltransferase
MLFIYFTIGCIIGSFLCLVAERVPLGQSILYPASHCTNCQTRLTFFKLIPLISILFLKFRCCYCQSKLSSIYFFSELTCGLLWLCVFLKSAMPVYTLPFLLGAFLLALTDIFYLIVEPKFFYPFAVLLCMSHFHLGLSFHFIAGFIALFGLLFLNYILPDSLGGGDSLIIILWSILLGSSKMILLLFIASGSGLLFLLIYPVYTRKKLKKLPFVPFLSIGLFVVLLYT